MSSPIYHIWHDSKGDILAVGEPVDGMDCAPVPTAEQFVLELTASEEDLAQLHLTHVVCLKEKLLIRRPDEDKRQG